MPTKATSRRVKQVVKRYRASTVPLGTKPFPRRFPPPIWRFLVNLNGPPAVSAYFPRLAFGIRVAMRSLISSVDSAKPLRIGVSSSWTNLNGAPILGLVIPVGQTAAMRPVGLSVPRMLNGTPGASVI